MTPDQTATLIAALTAVFVALAVGAMVFFAYRNGVRQGMQLAQIAWKLQRGEEPVPADNIDRVEVHGPDETQ